MPISRDLTYSAILTADMIGLFICKCINYWLFKGMRKKTKSFNLVGVSITPNKRAQGVSIKY